MDNLALAPIVKREVAGYARVIGLNASVFFLANDEQQVYAALDVFKETPTEPEVVVMAQVVGQSVVIHCDNTDRPLYEALLAAGIAREQIVLAYEGESLPKPVEHAH